ncbi:hypothetical protein DL98DRAFT_519327 [Cadophora sp. DSE1049]|nr:hypothetical protein DL98DRAFT_519327 [Cadophora sp. DSE1049]
MSLVGLPDELLGEIFSHVEKQQNLVALSLVCRRVHDALEPCLYSTFTQIRPEATPAFTRTILTKPHLSRHIKRFTARMIDTNARQLGHDDIPMGTRKMVQFKSSIREIIQLTKLSNKEQERWVYDMHTKINWDLCTAFLLLLMPNLEELSLRVYNEQLMEFSAFNTVNYLLKYIRLAEDRQLIPGVAHGCLSWLKSVTLEFWNERGSLDLGLQPFLGLDSIANFTFVGIGKFQDSFFHYGHDFADEDISPPRALATMANVTSVSLISINVPQQKLDQFFSYFPDLAKLEYTHVNFPDLDSIQHRHTGSNHIRLIDFSAGAFRNTIMRLENSLEELILGEDNFLCYNETEPLGSLTQFHKLRYFETAACILMGRDKKKHSYRTYNVESLRPFYTQAQLAASLDNLPSGLEELVMRKCRVDSFDWLDVLLSTLREGLCHLEKLKRVKFVFHEWSPSQLQTELNGRSRIEEATRYGIVVRTQPSDEGMFGPRGNIFAADGRGARQAFWDPYRYRYEAF